MTYTEQIIQKMIDGGYFNNPSYYIESGELVLVRSKDSAVTARIPIEKIFLDPEAWRALGKSMGWDVSRHRCHEMIDHLFDGGTIESYCKELIENN